ncbi:MAG TPA: Gfo/Idh/MocA family oxidoreductase [Armatimonadota bacterium]|jgi:predicted dehydrogenase
MIQVGIIGCGNIARFHYEGYERAGAQIAHVCDVRREAAEKVGSRYGSRVSTDYRELLADPAVQLVSVTSIASSHKEICLAAIAAGKGVVCEKTLTDNPQDSAEVARAAEQAGVFFATAYMKRYFPATQQAKALLADMGEIISIYARSWQPWNLWTTPMEERYLTHPSAVRQAYGGGVLVCGGSHILDLIHYFGGRPTQVCGQLHIRDGMDFDNQANAMLWLPNGIAHFETCWHPLGYAGLERNGWDERLEINATGGRLDLYTVRWDHPLNNGALLVHQDAVTGRTTEYRYQPMNPFDAEMAEMLRRYTAGEPATPSAWDGYVVDELIAQITASAEQNAVMPIDWKDSVRA